MVTISDEEQREYLKLKKRLPKIGKGEIESIIVCLKSGYLFSSFDNRAVSKVKELEVDVIVAGVIFVDKVYFLPPRTPRTPSIFPQCALWSMWPSFLKSQKSTAMQ